MSSSRCVEAIITQTFKRAQGVYTNYNEIVKGLIFVTRKFSCLSCLSLPSNPDSRISNLEILDQVNLTVSGAL